MGYGHFRCCNQKRLGDFSYLAAVPAIFSWGKLDHMALEEGTLSLGLA